MSANPIDKNTTPKTTGSLEELFRHHLGEEAAVPTRPMVWDQIDNSLLVRQNEIYRRRLVATRWVAAASLLLATLAGTGWWAGRDALLGGSGAVATGNRPATTGPDADADAIGTAGAGNRGLGAVSGADRTSSAAGSVASSSGNGAASQRLSKGGATARTSYSSTAQGAFATSPAPRYTGFGKSAGNSAAAVPGLTPGSSTSFAAASRRRTSTPDLAPTGANASVVAGRNTQAAPVTAGPLLTTDGPAAPALATNGTTVTTSNTVATTTALNSGGTSAARETLAAGGSLAAEAPATASALPTQVSLLATRPAALSLTNATMLPNGLTALPLEDAPTVASARKWHYGASYAAGTFNPNINFSRVGIESDYDYNPALGADSPKLTEAAAAQYRENLRPGLSQRIALLASRHLSGHWSLSTGLELSQASAKSASTAAFVGEQLYDLGALTNGPMRTTDFRYRLASIPVEVRYSNPAKKGWSLYGRLGGVVSALLGVRSDVEGNPEATKTYSILSAGTPYRRMLGSVRGGAGAQFRPTGGTWALTLGPVAELSLVSLNAHPAQDFLHQSRAYGFGIEAGVEFGR